MEIPDVITQQLLYRIASYKPTNLHQFFTINIDASIELQQVMAKYGEYFFDEV
jgi:hypothetical protein